MGTAQPKTVVLPNNPNKEKLQYEASLSCSPTNKEYVSNKTTQNLPPEQTGILDSGATHIYIAPNAPYEKMDATGTPLAELAASLAVSVDTVARKQIEIKHLTEHINALRKKGAASTASVPSTGDNNATACKHCKSVGRSVPHRNNHCFFDPRKNKNRVDWSAKLIEAKGAVFNDT